MGQRDGDSRPEQTVSVSFLQEVGKLHHRSKEIRPRIIVEQSPHGDWTMGLSIFGRSRKHQEDEFSDPWLTHSYLPAETKAAFRIQSKTATDQGVKQFFERDWRNDDGRSRQILKQQTTIFWNELTISAEYLEGEKTVIQLTFNMEEGWRRIGSKDAGVFQTFPTDS